MPYKERSKYKVFNTIAEKCDKHNINTKIVGEAKDLYITVFRNKDIKGILIETV